MSQKSSVPQAAKFVSRALKQDTPLKPSEATSPKPTPPSVQADRGSIAIGGNVTGATITTNGSTNSDTSAKQK
jgi:hypothetical protein